MASVEEFLHEDDNRLRKWSILFLDLELWWTEKQKNASLIAVLQIQPHVSPNKPVNFPQWGLKRQLCTWERTCNRKVIDFLRSCFEVLIARTWKEKINDFSVFNYIFNQNSWLDFLNRGDCRWRFSAGDDSKFKTINFVPLVRVPFVQICRPKLL